MSIPKHKANDGNRTRIASLEGWNSTIELHPQNTTNRDFFFLINDVSHNVYYYITEKSVCQPTFFEKNRFFVFLS